MINSMRPRARHKIINSRRLMMCRGSQIKWLIIKGSWNLRILIYLSSHNLIMLKRSSHRKIPALRTQNSNVTFLWLMINNSKPSKYSQRSLRKVSLYSKVREVKATGKQRRPTSALSSHQLLRLLWKQRREIVSDFVLFLLIYHIFLIWNIDVKSKVFEEDNAIQQPA